MSTCEYTHEVDGDPFDDLEGETWDCPHPTLEAGELCVFHWLCRHDDPPTDPAGYGAAIEAAIGSDRRERTRMIGAVFDGLDLDHLILDGHTNHPIDLRAATVRGPVEAADVEVEQDVVCDGAVFEGPVTFEGATFRGDATFVDARFRDRVTFMSARFGAWAGFDDCTFEGPVNFRVATLEKGISAMGATFDGGADLMNATFEQTGNFADATFTAGALFASVTFEGGFRLTDAEFGSEVAIGEDRRENPYLSEGDYDYNRDAIDGVAVLIKGCRCADDVSMDGLVAGGDVALVDCVLEGDVDMSDAAYRSESPSVDLRRTDSVSGVLPVDSGVSYDLRGATIGDVSFEEGEATLRPDQVDLRDAKFDGFDFGRHKRTFRRVDWDLYGDADADPSVKENTYLRAKNGAKDMGDTRAASEFHRRELDNRGLSHRVEIREGDSMGHGLYAFLRWVANRSMKYSCGYGERPSLVVFGSVVVVGLYTVAFAVVDIPNSYRGLAGPLVLSFNAFNALTLGFPPNVRDPVTGAIVASEAFLGPFFVALFVFTITQSINR